MTDQENPDGLLGETATRETAIVEDTGTDYEQEDRELASARKDAYDLGDLYTWQGKLLQPYTSSRDSHFPRIRKLFGSPPLSECLIDVTMFTTDAHIILWLCSHKWKKILAGLIQPNLAEIITEWAEKNIPRASAAEAVTTALDIYNDSKLNTAENAPSEDPLDRGGSSGN